MAWGAAATGTPAATGSTGQGLSLMQESLAEITLARLPLVVLNMARAQGDYFQATRGGGHGDYRHLVLAPADVAEAVELVQLAFHLTARWRNPVLVFGDYYLAHTTQSVARGAPRLRADAPTGLGPRRVDRWHRDGPSWSRSWGRPSNATTSATTSPSTTRRARRPPPPMVGGGRAAGRDACTPTTPRWSWWPSAHPPRYVRGGGAPTCGPTGPGSAWSGPITLFPFPSDAVAGRGRGRPGRGRLREQPGPDDRRRPPGRPRPRPGALHRRAEPRRLGLRHRARPRRLGPVARRIEDVAHADATTVSAARDTGRGQASWSAPTGHRRSRPASSTTSPRR